MYFKEFKRMTKNNPLKTKNIKKKCLNDFNKDSYLYIQKPKNNEILLNLNKLIYYNLKI